MIKKYVSESSYINVILEQISKHKRGCFINKCTWNQEHRTELFLLPMFMLSFV